jgi:hypothetical protein
MVSLHQSESQFDLGDDAEDAETLSRLFFASWADAAISDIRSKADVPLSNQETAFVIGAQTISEGADALLASVQRLVQVPKPTCLPTSMAGFRGRLPHDLADYFHCHASFELQVSTSPLVCRSWR